MNPQDTDIHEEALKLLWSSFVDPKNIDFLHINIGFLYSNYKDKVILLTWNCTKNVLPESKRYVVFHLYTSLIRCWTMADVNSWRDRKGWQHKRGISGGKIGHMCYQIKKHQKKISGAKWFKSTMIHLIAHLCEYFVISFMDCAKG